MYVFIRRLSISIRLYILPLDKFCGRNGTLSRVLLISFGKCEYASLLRNQEWNPQCK